MKENNEKKLSQTESINKTLSDAKKHKKYAASSQTLKQHVISKVPTWLKSNLIANATLFILGSIIWIHGAHTRSFDPDCDQPGKEKTGPYLEQRTYKQALKDAYWPFTNGEYTPEIDWQMTMGLIITFAAFSLAGMIKSAKKDHKKDLNATHAQIDIMLEIERLAKEHNLNASTAKEIVNVAPKIIMNMSADSRTYFDMILDGKISIEDKNFVNAAIAIMAGHLRTNPDDAKLIADIINDNSTIKGSMNLYTKNKVPSKLTINDFLKLHNINKENSTK